MNTIKKFLKDESGLELSEYAVAAAIVVVGLALAYKQLGEAILAKINLLKTNLNP